MNQKKNMEPIKEGEYKTYSVWEFAQASYQKLGKGVVYYKGLGSVCKYIPAISFSNMLSEQAKEIQKALLFYRPSSEIIVATPTSDKSEICDVNIVKENSPIAQLLLGKKEEVERFK